MVTLAQLKSRLPGLNTSVESFLSANGIPYISQAFCEPTILEENAEKAVQLFYQKLNEEKQEQERIIQLIQGENAKKERAISQMLVTTGFNFEGYRIVKYAECISSDCTISIDYSSSVSDSNVRVMLADLMPRARRNTLEEIKETAYNLGCNAIIGINFDHLTLTPQGDNYFDSSSKRPHVVCVTANGTAVVVERVEN